MQGFRKWAPSATLPHCPQYLTVLHLTSKQIHAQVPYKKRSFLPS